MFKNVAFLLAVALFGFCFYSLYAEKSPAFRAYANEYEIYLSTGSFGDNIVRTDEKGFTAFTKVKGESCRVTVSYEKVLKDFSAKHLFTEKTADGESYYAYSPKLKYKVILKGKAVNIQYYNGGGQKVLGTPMIFGSF